MPKQYSPEVLALRDRVILGNKKLNDAWEEIKKMVHDTEEWNRQMERWHQANEKLSALCTQLKVTGYEDCLYLDSLVVVYTLNIYILVVSCVLLTFRRTCTHSFVDASHL